MSWLEVIVIATPAAIVLLALVAGVQMSDNSWNERFEAERQAARSAAAELDAKSEAA